MKQRILIVSNRLPASAKRRGEDQWSLDISAGGLVSALLGRQGDNNEELRVTFDAYKRVNQMFADVVFQHYQEGGVIWIHDFHLMFLPKYLKDHDINMKVGWFHHSPFPSSEIYRMLPSRLELLRAVLCSDIVGFHTYDFTRHFVSACTGMLGLEGTPEGVEDHGRLTRVVAFPIGMDSDRFRQALELPEVKRHISELTQRFAGRKVILGVDRLDIIKGIPQKILAFEKFLEENPDWSDKVVLLQIAVPTRTGVPKYQKLTSQVHEIVGRINGRFGTLTAVPIHHLDQSIDFHALCALYAVSDVALITSLRDGMNLVSYEYVACQESKKGVLILSEGFNSTLTEAVESSGRRGVDQIEMELKLHPDLKGPLKALCDDERTTIIVLSGSDRSVLDDNFGDFNMWLAAEHGMFLRPTHGQWMTTMPEHLNMDWVESVKLLCSYLPIWKDVEFGRLQARDMLQHLWTGPISNAAVDVVQGSRSVEVRSAGVTKGAAIERILGEIVHSKNMVNPIDYVLCIGHFLGKDEDIYAFLDPEYSSESKMKPEAGSLSLDRSGRINSRNSPSRVHKAAAASERSSPSGHSTTTSNHDWREGSSVLDLNGENYFSCTVGRKQSNARFLLNSSNEVVSVLKELATATPGYKSSAADF
ncbi:hypothetical protein PR202_ga24639 [Eleusine coracana subsp. coracana]|uniref:Alpha,alpha-trehalose-phosphate synthase (UDP-forming) n=1 Tax=Eleusine coracana subsp. coracana TaxID=191504 RepID=A0AAV5D7B3_ELECO|nr:hypothetical protein PR202_ga24639 [Eleusine coracana subsp. coracana]